MSLQTWKRMSRVFFMVVITFAALLVVTSHANAATCKVTLEGFKNPIVGKGATKNLAFEDAATICFEKKRASSLRSAASTLSEDAGLAIIDECANVRCEG